MKNNWKSKKWIDVLEVRSGRNHLEVEIPNGKYPILGSAGKTMGYTNDFICEEGTTIIGRKGNINNPFYIETKFWNIDTAFGLVASKILDKKFLYYFCLSYDFNQRDKGSGRPSLVKKDIQQILMPIPPLPEQKQIVALLDKAFAAIDQAKANIEKNIDNTKELFQSKLNEIFSQKGDGWEEKKLQDVCEKITDGTHQTPKYFDSGVIFLSSKNVTTGKINWNDIKYIDEAQHIEMHKRVAPQPKDILLAKNGTTGVAAMVDRDVVFDIYVSLAHIRSLGVVVPEYMLHYINSPLAKVQFNKRLKGIGVPNLHLKEIREVIIRYPISVDKQQEIVIILDGIKNEVDRVSKKYRLKLDKLDDLKKSILQKAFSGELTKDFNKEKTYTIAAQLGRVAEEKGKY